MASPDTIMSDDASDFYDDDNRLTRREAGSEIEHDEYHRPAAAKPNPDGHQTVAVNNTTSNPDHKFRTSQGDEIEVHSTKRKFDSLPVTTLVKRRKVLNLPRVLYSKLVPSTAGVPAEVWQHVLSFLPLDSLCLCLRVNKAFNAYLTRADSRMGVTGFSPVKRLQIVDSGSIWKSSREMFAPSLPDPLFGISELAMVRLLTQTHCECCFKEPPPTHLGQNLFSAFTAGPGNLGVRLIWPFAERLCGDCFSNSQNVIKDIDLLKSVDGPLKRGLPFAFRTQDNHYIPSPAGAPKSLALSKVYFIPQIEAIRQERDAVESSDPDQVHLWYQNLNDQGQRLIKDAQRWVSWESRMVPGNPIVEIVKSMLAATRSDASTVQDPRSPDNSVNILSYPLPYPEYQSAPGAPSFNTLSAAYGISPHPGISSWSQQPSPLPNPPYGLHPHSNYESEQVKAYRKGMIEHLCKTDMQPPLMPDVLRYFDSYNTAIQIAQPLNDFSWSVLKPALDAERATAEEKQWKHEQEMRFLQATMHESRPSTQIEGEGEADNDRRFEALQEQIRPQLIAIADKVISERWHDGTTVSRTNAPTFAADVLIETRKAFYEEYLASHPQTSPDEILLSLDSMKFLVEQKIRPRIDRICAEPYRCAECEDSGKWRAFEGVVQHYGAKHTEDFGKDNIIVHWKTAPWLLDTPFDPQPVPGQKPPGIVEDNPQPSNAASHRAPRMSSPPLINVHELLASLQTPHRQSQPDQADQIDQVAPVARNIEDSAPSSSATDLSDSMRNETSAMAITIWQSLDKIPQDLLHYSTRVQVLIENLRKRYKNRTHQTLPLSLLRDIVSNTPLAEENLMHIKKLACQLCVSESSDESLWSLPFDQKLKRVNTFVFEDFLEHFQQYHYSVGDDASLSSMIELPEEDGVADVMNLVTDEFNRQLIASAFSKRFPTGPPPLTNIQVEAVRVAEEMKMLNKKQSKNRTPAEKAKARKEREKAEAQYAAQWHEMSYDENTPDYDSGATPPQPADDEYDPTRPAVASVQEMAEHQLRSTGQPLQAAPPANFTLGDLTAALTSHLAAQGALARSGDVRDSGHEEGRPKPRHEGNRRHSDRVSKRSRAAARAEGGRREEEEEAYPEEYPAVIRSEDEPTTRPTEWALPAHYASQPAPPQQVEQAYWAQGNPVYAPVERLASAEPYPPPRRALPYPQVYWQGSAAYEQGSYLPPVPAGYGPEPRRFVDEAGRPVIPERVYPLHQATGTGYAMPSSAAATVPQYYYGDEAEVWERGRPYGRHG